MNEYASQSALDTAGEGAYQIAQLFYAMTIGGFIIWLLVIGGATYALLRPTAHHPTITKLIVIGGGAVFPTIVLTILLSYGLSLLPDLQSPAPPSSQVVEVAGVRWWWRVTYRLGSGDKVELANELRLPVDEAVEFKLTSEDVIHSFWIPSLGGKMDMVPGRQNRLKLMPTRPGNFRGVCAEFCGAAHAQMAFDVIVMPRPDFEAWLAVQAEPARTPSDDLSREGQVIFTKSGCGACHTIRGSSADGVLGPDLTHFGGRRSIGASLMRNNAENLRNWIQETHRLKPGVEMPAFEALDPNELDALVAYLEQLQ